MISRNSFGLSFAGAIAIIAIAALTIEFTNSMMARAALHRGLIEALYLHLRYFTILTNWGITILLVATIAQAARGRILRPRVYGAALIYSLVVGVTYEILLRSADRPHGLSVFANFALHDIIPAFYFAYWIGFAPKRGLRLRDALAWLAPPAAYLGATLLAGAAGEGYPYFFLDAATLGYRGVMTNALVFLLAFFLLGLGVVLLARALPSHSDV